MNAEEKYLFDLHGYIVIENAIAPDALAEMNRWMDEKAKDKVWRSGRQHDLLAWGQPFRDLLDNSIMLPYLVELMGEGVRLDHDYAILCERGDGALELHGGGTPYDPAQFYHAENGRMYNGLTVASYALTDIAEGGGGLAVIPGSHKSRFPLPPEYRHFTQENRAIRQVPMRAGDCVLFTEALTHGTFAWNSDHLRRSLFFKYAPKHMSWASRYYAPGSGRDLSAYESYLTPRQQIFLDPPSVHQHRKVTPA